MKAAYQDSNQPGYGQIILSEALFPSEPWGLAIQRASDQNYVSGLNRWVPEAFFIPVAGSAAQDGTLKLEIGPEIVDSLDQQEQYLLTLRGEGQSQKARLRVTSITYSPVVNVDNTARQTDPSTPVPPPPPVEEPQPAPVNEPQPAPEPIQMPPQPHPQRKIWQFVLLGILILGCLAWYFLDPRKGTFPETRNAQQSTPPKQESPQTLSAEEQVRQFFKSGNISPAQAVELAAKLPKTTSADQDAVYRLLYFAAENGDKSVMIDYGNVLNPELPAFGTIQKNAREAWQAYEKAQETEPAKAAQAMEKLRHWLTDQVAKGNAQAKEWLLQIDQPR